MKKTISAKDFRKMGMVIPENIPDCAWIPRYGWYFDPDKITCKSEKENEMTFELQCIFTHPFQWITTTFRVDG